MSTQDRITNDIKDAMRAGDKKKVSSLRLITAAIKQIEVDERIVVDEERMQVILDKLARQRKESIAQFESAGRQDLVAQEQYELELISNYQEEPLSETEIDALITQAFNENDAQKISDMGKVMAWLKPRMIGRADMSQISAIVKAKLS